MTVPLPTQGVQAGDAGHITDHNATADYLQVLAQSGAGGATAAYMPYNVRSFGAVGNGTADDTAAIKAAFQAAENSGGRKVIYFPTGTYVITGTLPLSGYSSVIRGDGCQNSASVAGGTTLKCMSQTGPVLNFTGYRWPDYGGRAVFSGFNIVGDGTTDTGGVKCGILLPAAINASFSDLTITACGAAPLSINGANYCDFSRILITNPVGALANDVAWISAASVLGCRFSTILLHSLLSTADVGASGAVRVFDAASGLSSSGNSFTDLMFDSLHLPTNGEIISHKGNGSVLSNMTFSGCVKTSGATATAFIRLAPPVSDVGGNTVSGLIPGKGTTATDIDTGVDISQSGNRVVGTKGFQGANVTLESGVTNTVVALEGAAAGATAAGIVDSSGQTSNVYTDDSAGTVKTQNYTLTPKPTSPGGAGVQVSDSGNVQLGAVYFGNQGSAVQNGATQPKSLYYTGDHHYFRDSTKAITPLTLSTVAAEVAAILLANASNTTALRLGGVLDFNTDNASDIGAAAANRPRDLNAGRDVVAGRNLTVAGTGTVTGQLSMGSILIGGHGLQVITAGSVGGITTTAAGRFTWTNPLGEIPDGLVVCGQSGGSLTTTYEPHVLAVTSSAITLYFTLGNGTQASTTSGVSFRFMLLQNG